ncbi:exonuclease RecJ [Tenacibaculum sp. MAR_2009_124]|uniref:single-stranded-DNA-specific exonuclease RecJ n=1 Tax=Tenacibaculum sp. MAR_2009_124 TaxID=1250059 RepID=UPI000895D590|nr:single-stranded-DNA-specific exonuclease RecJ [Tenacibaculum sp. MAR_2009_124]SEC29731.1 exonuclease RecJ [Tenacibaculum sp. MAR_2009_124]
MRWTFKPEPNEKEVEKLAEELGIDRVLSKLLVQRGIKTFDEAKSFFRPSLDDLHDPFLMKDMNLAVQRIEKAIEDEEKILVYGDYDVDGTTAVSLMYSYLMERYSKVATYIPDRYKEGYGVSFQGVDFAVDNGFQLIIALDCGIKAIDKVEYAKERNVDFIICDHHKPGEKVPEAVAILNPKQVDCEYPYKELCGCGVGFKLIEALEYRNDGVIDNLIPYLDLVATAVAADIVPITGENRVLAYFGLQVINTAPRNGIKAIIHQLEKSELTVTDVVFVIAPRINAAGRIKHGNFAVSLLTELDFETAKEEASNIEKFNSDRKELDAAITQEALVQIEDNNEEEKFTTVVYDENWHKGVIGIVASRLIETFYRPTIVFTKSGDKLAASARSVKGFDVYNAIEACSEFLVQFGGHKYAAGLTILPEQYDNFKRKFEEVVAASISKDLLVPEIGIDAELDLCSISPKFYRILQQMAPFGPQNMKPVFYSSSVRDNGYGKQVGSDKSHLKLNVIYGADRRTYGAIGFSLGKKINLIENGFDIAYCLDENTWNGVTSIQLIVKDLK